MTSLDPIKCGKLCDLLFLVMFQIEQTSDPHNTGAFFGVSHCRELNCLNCKNANFFSNITSFQSALKRFKVCRRNYFKKVLSQAFVAHKKLVFKHQRFNSLLHYSFISRKSSIHTQKLKKNYKHQINRRTFRLAIYAIIKHHVRM